MASQDTAQSQLSTQHIQMASVAQRAAPRWPAQHGSTLTTVVSAAEAGRELQLPG